MKGDGSKRSHVYRCCSTAPPKKLAHMYICIYIHTSTLHKIHSSMRSLCFIVFSPACRVPPRPSRSHVVRGDAAAKHAVSWARPQDDGRKPRILDIYNYLCVLGIHVCVYVYVINVYIYILCMWLMSLWFLDTGFGPKPSRSGEEA